MIQRVRIGLVLDAKTIKVAWCLPRRGGTNEWRYHEQPRSGDPQDSARLAQELALALAPLRRHWLRAQLILSAPSSMMHRLTLQVPDARRLPEAITQRLTALLPLESDRAEIRYTVSRQQRTESFLDCTVSVAACERAGLERDLDALWQAGWLSAAALPAALALTQAAKALGMLPPEPTVLMDVGQRRTTIALVEAGEVRLAREVALGDEHLTDALATTIQLGDRTLALSREQAEVLKQQLGLPGGEQEEGQVGGISVPTRTYVSLIQPILEQLITELRRTMTTASQAKGGSSPTQVLLSGELALRPNADAWLSSQLAMPVRRVQCDAWVGQAGSRAVAACGLALCDSRHALDLAPSTVRQRATFVRAAAWLWRSLAVVTLLIWLSLGATSIRHQVLRRQLNQAQARWQALHPVVSVREALVAHAELMQRMAREGMEAAWLERLANGFPSPVRLTQLSVNPDGQVTLTGQAQERGEAPEAHVSALALRLEQARLCEQLKLGPTQRLGGVGGLVEFSMTCRVK